MDQKLDADGLIARIDALRHPCDLDVLLFFVRHPRTLLASGQLTSFLGYGSTEIAASLDLFLEKGLLTRTPTLNPQHAARMYTLGVGGSGGGWLPALSRLAATRQGRLALLSALRERGPGGHGVPEARLRIHEPAPPARPVLLMRNQTQPGNPRRQEREGHGGKRNG